MNIRELESPCYIINSEDYEATIEGFKAEFEQRWSGNVKFGYSVKTNTYTTAPRSETLSFPPSKTAPL